LGGFNTYTIISGHSMEPTLHTGDLLISRASQEYETGMIVTYGVPDVRYHKARIVHRIVSKTADGRYEIQGDNQDHIDPWLVAPGNILGGKVLVIPRGGFLVRYSYGPYGLAVLFGMLLTWTFWPDNAEEELELATFQDPLYTYSELDEPLQIRSAIGRLSPIAVLQESLAVSGEDTSFEVSEENPSDLKTPDQQNLTIDQLLEQWINDPADAPIPEQFLLSL
jgi:signal peptidase I